MSPVTEKQKLEKATIVIDWNSNYHSQMHFLKLKTMHTMHAFSFGNTWG